MLASRVYGCCELQVPQQKQYSHDAVQAAAYGEVAAVCETLSKRRVALHTGLEVGQTQGSWFFVC